MAFKYYTSHRAPRLAWAYCIAQSRSGCLLFREIVAFAIPTSSRLRPPEMTDADGPQRSGCFVAVFDVRVHCSTCVSKCLTYCGMSSPAKFIMRVRVPRQFPTDSSLLPDRRLNLHEVRESEPRNVNDSGLGEALKQSHLGSAFVLV